MDVIPTSYNCIRAFLLDQNSPSYLRGKEAIAQLVLGVRDGAHAQQFIVRNIHF